MQENMLISVILPIRNAGELLEASLQSLLSQSYSNIEIIAIDDFSRDNSYAILRSFAKKDKRLQVFRNVKQYGMRVTLNRALKHAKGNFIAFARAQDLNDRLKLEKQFDFLLNNEGVVALGTQCYFIDKTGKKIGKSEFSCESEAIYKRPVQGISFIFETMMINRNRLPKDILEFHTNRQPFLYSDLCVKLLQYGKVVNLSECLYSNRKVGQNQPKGFINANFMNSLKVWLRATTIFDHQLQISSFFPAFIKPQFNR